MRPERLNFIKKFINKQILTGVDLELHRAMRDLHSDYELMKSDCIKSEMGKHHIYEELVKTKQENALLKITILNLKASQSKVLKINEPFAKI